MKHLYRLAAFTVFFSFTFGLTWSIFLKKPDHQTHAHSLALLLPHNMEDLGFSKSLTTHSNIMVTPLVYRSFEELESLLEKRSADAVIVPSATASRLIDTQLIPRLPKTLSNLLSFIHVDFKSLGFDPDNNFTIPLFWGVNGMASAEDGDETVRISRIDDFVQKHFLDQTNQKNSALKFHNLSRESLTNVKSTHNLIQLPASFFPLFESLPSKNNKRWTFSIPESEGDFWILSLGVLDEQKTPATEALMEFLFTEKFLSTFLREQPLGVTYLTLKNLPDNQHPQFLRTLPLKRIQIRDFSASTLRNIPDESDPKKEP